MKQIGKITIWLIALFGTLLVGCTDELFETPNLDNESKLTTRGNTDISSTIALLHFNPVLGDKNANIKKLEYMVAQAFENGANIIVTPELSTSGYCITKEQVFNGLGLEAPFNDLNTIKEMAIDYQGYVFIGLPEISDNVAYNSIIILGPQGYVGKQRKRGKSEWHEVGNMPYEILETPFGDIGFLVCSDAYLPDLTRILALKGADMIVSPANWWGEGISATQLDIWKTNAHDNGVWNFVANRWGTETDNRSGYSYVYDMNTAPSAVISPSGDVVFSYYTNEDNANRDTIFYQTATIPVEKIGNAFTYAYSLNNRNTYAYQAIGNEYYNPDDGNTIISNLPKPGILSYTALSYIPSVDFSNNMDIIRHIFREKNIDTDVVIAPAFGIGKQSINNQDTCWYKDVDTLQSFVDEKQISLFATTVQLIGNTNTVGLLVLKKNDKPEIIPQIHKRLDWVGSNAEPFYIDLPQVRIGIVTGTDFNFPEITTALAKKGVDVVLISSDLGYSSNNANTDNYYWKLDQLKSLMLTRSNHSVHMLMADHLGIAMNLRSEWGAVAELNLTEKSNDAITISLNASDTRTKYLNRYRPYDLATLLGY